jgi:hypothetical protein
VHLMVGNGNDRRTTQLGIAASDCEGRVTTLQYWSQLVKHHARNIG